MSKYSYLVCLLRSKNISNEILAKLLNVHINTIYRKLNGESFFTIEEICLIRDTFFKDKTIDSLIVQI